MLDVRKLAIALVSLCAASFASAQVSIDYEDAVAAVPDGTTVATMSVNWTNDTSVGNGGISSLQMEMTLPAGVTLAACNAGANLGGAHVIATCDDSNTGPGSFTISWFSFSNALLPDGEIATLDFTVAPGVSGTQPIGLTDLTNPALNSMADTAGAEVNILPGTNFNADGGSLDVPTPPGGIYASDPAPGSELDLGSAVVNSAATPVDDLTISNASADSYDVSFSGGTAELSLPGGTTTIPGNDGSVVFNPSCTPDAVGTNSGGFSVTHTAANGPSSPVSYTYTCTGLAPNVQVAPTSLNLSASIGGTAPTATFDIRNPDNGTASDAQNVTVTDQGGSAEISITDGLTNNVITVGETDTIEVSCDTTNFGTFNETIRVMWNDPTTGGTAMQDVSVECNIANVAPGYSSAPAPGSTISFTTPFGTPSTQTINIGNENSVGSGTGAELNVTGATLSNTTEFSISPASPSFTLPAGATNGTESIDVTCTPPGVGTIPTATLTVQTNDGDQAYNLSCEGTGDALTSTPPSGGSLNLGTVAPGTTTPPGSIAVTNNTLDTSFDLSCSVTGDTDAFGNPASPINFSVAAGATNDSALTFQCTPPSVGQFSLSLSCTQGQTVAGEGVALTYTVNCSGRPLVVPTLSNWGLVLMALFVLGIGGLVGRRMMA